MNRFFRKLVFAALAAGLVSLAPAADRVALVIGNNEYPEDSNFHALNNCVNDARLLAKTLKEVGFEVTILTDASFSEMDEALLKFEGDIPEGGTALVYFAGHGIEYQGQNYLMGSNAKLKARSRLGEEALKADTFAAALVQAGAKSSFLLLDCCREMPTSAEWAGRGQKKFGLADISISGDVVIGMAAAPGRQALEPNEAGGNSPYALALAKWIPSGLKHTDLFDEVRREVDGMTKGQQRTWENGSFLNPFYFAEKAEAKPKVDAPMTKKLAEMKAQFEAELERVRLEKEAAEKALVAKADTMKKTAPSKAPIAPFGKADLSDGLEMEGFNQFLIEILSAEKEARKNKQSGETESAFSILTDAELDEKIAALKAEAESADHGSAMKKKEPSTTPSMGLDKIFSASRGIEGKKAGEEREFGGMDFVWCPPGEFLMGSPESEEGREDDEKQHRVTLTKGFWMAKTECTQGQWESLMGTDVTAQKAKGNYLDEVNGEGSSHPMYFVSWEDCQEWLKKMNAKAPLPKGWKWVLPSEAQWEYACRAGTETVFSHGNSLSSKQANFNGSYSNGGAAEGPYLEKTADVGSYAANDWGLLDMHGNVWEWCSDWYSEDYYSDGHSDPTGSATGSNRVFRGGSWYHDAQYCRAADRFGFTPEGRLNYLGFRVCLSSLPAR